MPSQSSKLLGAAILAAASLTAARASADDACVTAAVAEAYASCASVSAAPIMTAADLLAAAPPPPAPPARAPKRGNAPPLVPRELDDREKKLDAAMRRFACEDNPSGDPRARQQHAEVEYARARIQLGANRFQEAAVGLRDVATRRADTTVGIQAAELYLWSLSVMGMQGAPSCYDDMARDVPVLLDLYCKDGKDKAAPDPCNTMMRIRIDILRLEAERVIGPRGRMASYEEAARRYLDIWNKYGRAACEAGTPLCERMDEILYNAARAHQAARHPHDAIEVRRILLDPRYRMHKSPLAIKVQYEIAGSYQALAFYEEAADWYERFARASPKDEKAPDALKDALILRLGLGQIAEADADMQSFEKSYGGKRPALAARIAFAVTSHAIDHDDFEGARRRLTQAMGMIDKAGSIDVQMQAHALLGRALAARGLAKPAAAEYGKVKALFRDPAAVVRRLQTDAEGEDDRRLGRLLVAVGEATFFFADEKGRAADALGLPAYGGSGRKEDVDDWFHGAFAKAVNERRRAIGEAEKAYLEVLALEPLPPPKWVARAVARVARMHGKLAAEIRSAPAPRAWAGRGFEAIRAAFRQSLEQASEAEWQHAKETHRRCLHVSIKYQYADDHTRACASWLSKHAPHEYPRVDELGGRPTHTAFGVLQGQPMVPDPEPASPR